MSIKKAPVYIIKTNDRQKGITQLMKKFELKGWSDKNVVLKANYNSSDPFPASTHINTLENIVKLLKENSVGEITLAERSGMGNTHDVLEKCGVYVLEEEMDFKIMVLDEEDHDIWKKISGKNTHWLKGFYLPKIVFEADKVVQTCCLKTHRFGGHFTLSLKNSVGLVAKRVPGSIYNYMAELHVSPFQRQMIAEINKNYQVDLIIMDAIKAFVSGGPHKGKEVEPNLLLASSDRVAMDVIGVAILRLYGVKGVVKKGPIFNQMQIKRASELGIGVSSAAEIDLIALNEEASEIVNRINTILEEDYK